MAKKQQDPSEKKGGGGGLAAAVLGALVIAPLVVFGAAYFLSDTVKNVANPILSQLPGPIGAFFDSYPTQAETTGQVQQISDYLLSIEKSRAVDKLNLIRKDDEALYNEVVKGMLRQDPNAADALLEELRQSNLKKNVLTSIIDSIKSEQDTALTDRAKYIDSLGMLSAMDELHVIINESHDGLKKAAAILEFSADERTAAYLEALRPEDRSQILDAFSAEKASKIRSLLSNRENLKTTLTNTAQILSTEEADKLAGIIGNENTYKVPDLAVIYSEIGPMKAGEVLAKVQDQALVFSILNAIKDQQMLTAGEDKVTEDIQKALKVYKSFDDNISELNSIFSKLDDQKIADILKKYFQNAGTYKAYPLSNGDEIRISDEDLAITVLKKMSQKKVAAILTFFDSTLSSEVSKKLALPQN